MTLARRAPLKEKMMNNVSTVEVLITLPVTASQRKHHPTKNLTRQYKNLLASLKLKNMDTKVLLAEEEEEWVEKEESSEEEERKDACLMAFIEDPSVEKGCSSSSTFDVNLSEAVNDSKNERLRLLLFAIAAQAPVCETRLVSKGHDPCPQICTASKFQDVTSVKIFLVEILKIMSIFSDKFVSNTFINQSIADKRYILNTDGITTCKTPLTIIDPSLINHECEHENPSTETLLKFPISNGEGHDLKDLLSEFLDCTVSNYDTDHSLDVGDSKCKCKVCYICGDTSHKIGDCPFEENTKRIDNLKESIYKWIKKDNSLNCLPECYNISNETLPIKRPIAEWVILLGQLHIWYVDSGWSKHMTRFKSLLEDYVKKDDHVVTYGDNGKGFIKCFGTINCKSIEFKNVFYVKGLKHNLASTSQLCDADYGRRQITMTFYIMNIFSADNAMRHCIFSRTQSHLNWLWHKWLSHLNFKAISKISNAQLVRGLPQMKFEKDVVQTTHNVHKESGSDLILSQVYFADVMARKFEMSMMWLQVKQLNQCIFINQSKYIADMNPISPLVKTTADSTSPDIMCATSMCARYQANPKESHLLVVKRIFRYLKHTPNFGLWYPHDSAFHLVEYTDYDHAGCALGHKSISSDCQLLGHRLISWSNKKQSSMAYSTTEEKYVVVGGCCAQILWIQNQLLDYGFKFPKTPIYCDNTSAILITQNLFSTQIPNTSRSDITSSGIT
ncbi:hypothetical protein LXL04_021038 [Taraxacum kok-saghyz]